MSEKAMSLERFQALADGSTISLPLKCVVGRKQTKSLLSQLSGRQSVTSKVRLKWYRIYHELHLLSSGDIANGWVGSSLTRSSVTPALAMFLSSDGPPYELRLVINGTGGDVDIVELECNRPSG